MKTSFVRRQFTDNIPLPVQVVDAFPDSGGTDMERTKINEAVFDMISQNIGIDISTLTENTSQIDLGIDSILLIDLMLALEDRLEFSFTSLEMPKNPTIGNIVDMIEKEMLAN
jgi:acyl carrier protein